MLRSFRFESGLRYQPMKFPAEDAAANPRPESTADASSIPPPYVSQMTLLSITVCLNCGGEPARTYQRLLPNVRVTVAKIYVTSCQGCRRR